MYASIQAYIHTFAYSTSMNAYVHPEIIVKKQSGGVGRTRHCLFEALRRARPTAFQFKCGPRHSLSSWHRLPECGGDETRPDVALSSDEADKAASMFLPSG